jgi:hypothetical protein
LDTIKVHLQTQKKTRLGLYGITNHMIKTSGFMSLYNGLSAAILRQGTYSTFRFAFYEASKEFLLARNQKNQSLGQNTQKIDLPFYQKIIIAGVGGGAGSLFGIYEILFSTSN